MIEFNKDGTIKDFSVPDAHTITVKAFMVNQLKPIRVEALTMASIETLDQLHLMVDTQDGYIFGQKWKITPEVIKELKSKGESKQNILGFPLHFEYKIRKTKHADNLKHKG